MSYIDLKTGTVVQSDTGCSVLVNNSDFVKNTTKCYFTEFTQSSLKIEGKVLVSNVGVYFSSFNVTVESTGALCETCSVHVVIDYGDSKEDTVIPVVLLKDSSIIIPFMKLPKSLKITVERNGITVYTIFDKEIEYSLKVKTGFVLIEITNDGKKVTYLPTNEFGLKELVIDNWALDNIELKYDLSGKKVFKVEETEAIVPLTNSIFLNVPNVVSLFKSGRFLPLYTTNKITLVPTDGLFLTPDEFERVKEVKIKLVDQNEKPETWTVPITYSETSGYSIDLKSVVENYESQEKKPILFGQVIFGDESNPSFTLNLWPEMFPSIHQYLLTKLIVIDENGEKVNEVVGLASDLLDEVNNYISNYNAVVVKKYFGDSSIPYQTFSFVPTYDKIDEVQVSSVGLTIERNNNIITVKSVEGTESLSVEFTFPSNYTINSYVVYGIVNTDNGYDELIITKTTTSDYVVFDEENKKLTVKDFTNFFPLFVLFNVTVTTDESGSSYTTTVLGYSFVYSPQTLIEVKLSDDQYVFQKYSNALKIVTQEGGETVSVQDKKTYVVYSELPLTSNKIMTVSSQTWSVVEIDDISVDISSTSVTPNIPLTTIVGLEVNGFIYYVTLKEGERLFDNVVPLMSLFGTTQIEVTVKEVYVGDDFIGYRAVKLDSTPTITFSLPSIEMEVDDTNGLIVTVNNQTDISLSLNVMVGNFIQTSYDIQPNTVFQKTLYEILSDLSQNLSSLVPNYVTFRLIAKDENGLNYVVDYKVVKPFTFQYVWLGETVQVTLTNDLVKSGSFTFYTIENGELKSVTATPSGQPNTWYVEVPNKVVIVVYNLGSGGLYEANISPITLPSDVDVTNFVNVVIGTDKITVSLKSDVPSGYEIVNNVFEKVVRIEPTGEVTNLASNVNYYTISEPGLYLFIFRLKYYEFESDVPYLIFVPGRKVEINKEKVYVFNVSNETVKLVINGEVVKEGRYWVYEGKPSFYIDVKLVKDDGTVIFEKSGFVF